MNHLSRIWNFGFNRLRSGPFEGPAIVIPPALPEDTYFKLSLCKFLKLFLRILIFMLEQGGGLRLWKERYPLLGLEPLK